MFVFSVKISILAILNVHACKWLGAAAPFSGGIKPPGFYIPTVSCFIFLGLP